MESKFTVVKNVTWAAIKMYFRDWHAIFWSLFLPLLIMGIFGILDFERAGDVQMGLVDNSKTEFSRGLSDSLKKVETLKITEGNIDDEKKALEKGERIMVLIIPEGIEKSVVIQVQGLQVGTKESAKLELLYNEGKAAQVATGTIIINQVLDRVTHVITKTPDLFVLDRKAVQSHNLRSVDYLIPGILGFAIMQMGIMGVSMVIVNWREKGILRRVMATPVHPSVIVFSQLITRLIISVLQVSIILLLGVLAFKVTIIGNIALIYTLVFLGSLIFLSMGLAISGIGKTANTVPAVANIVMMPMMFLSGVFFSRESFPEIVKNISQYLPLTYLADALRTVMTEGASAMMIQKELWGLTIWLFVCFFAATKLFRWE